MPTSASPPTALAVLQTLIGVTLRRLFRGRALWVSVVIAMLPVLLAVILKGRGHNSEPMDVVQFLVLVLLPPMFVASSLGEEIEDRTTTYLWSRPIARWTIVAGKLIALAPIAVVLVLAGYILSNLVGFGFQPSPTALVAMAGGVFAIASLSAGIATLVPKHGMALTIVYLVVFDLTFGALPASINNISITRQVRLIAWDEYPVAQPAITMALLAAFWLALAFARIRRLES